MICVARLAGGAYKPTTIIYMMKCIQDNSVDTIQIKVYFAIYIKAKRKPVHVTKKKGTKFN